MQKFCIFKVEGRAVWIRNNFLRIRIQQFFLKQLDLDPDFKTL